MDTAFVGRQPVFDRELNVHGYELLFRSGTENSVRITDGDRATTSVLLNTFTDIGLDTIVGTRKAYINLTRNLLLHRDLSCLPADRMVLELLEDIQPDPEVLEAVRELSQQGYTIAMDDVVYRPELEPLIQLADIVKLEFPQIPTEELPHQIACLRKAGVKTLLAEKLETQADFELCKDLGFDLFQGFFFCRPQIVSRPKLKSNVAALMRLVCELQDPEITAAAVERVLQTDPKLSYKVLRFVNSATSATCQTIESLRHATALMGVSRLRSLASMMLLTGVDRDKPCELLNVAITRAKMCELLGKAMGDQRADRLYTMGLLSVMDAMLDIPMSEVVGMLPLAADMNGALLDRTGDLGEILSCVIRHETGTPDAEHDTLSSQQVSEAYVQALRWAAEYGQAT